MNVEKGVLVLSADAFITGEIHRCRRVEVYGYIDGRVATEQLIIHQGGRLYGTVSTSDAQVSGDIQGDITVNKLLDIKSVGAVSGNVRYGQLAMQPGGDLSAELTNVPPSLAGDLEVSVTRGGTVTITTVDLTAIDPDDAPADLTFTVSEERGGMIVLSDDTATGISQFTQADLEANKVCFKHDGSGGSYASFKAMVADDDGATSGKAQTVNVRVNN